MKRKLARYVPRDEAKKLILEVLKTAFPGVKFYLRKSRGGWYTTYYVHWKPNKEGKSPTKEQVSNVLWRFEDSTTDPMQDMVVPKGFKFEIKDKNGKWVEAYPWPIDWFIALGHKDGSEPTGMEPTPGWEKKVPVRSYKVIEGANGKTLVPNF